MNNIFQNKNNNDNNISNIVNESVDNENAGRICSKSIDPKGRSGKTGNNYFITNIALCLICISVIISPKIALAGTLEGLKLWSLRVLPALFPTLIITSCLLKRMRVPDSLKIFCTFVFGLFAGFPGGAILCRNLVEQNPGISKKTVNALLPLCNLSSPAFLTGYVYLQTNQTQISLPQILLCVYLPVFEMIIIIMLNQLRIELFERRLLSTCFSHSKNSSDKLSTYSKRNCYERAALSSEHTSTAIEKNTPQITHSFIDDLDTSITDSVNALLKLAGYICFFSCLLKFLQLLPLNSLEHALIGSSMEITNGIHSLGSLDISVPAKISLILIANSFGGISTIMQTWGIIKNSSLSIQKYIRSKLLLAILTGINCIFLL